MTCERCTGLMVIDHYRDLDGGQIWQAAWKCVNCGDVVDAQIMKHRLMRGRRPTPQEESTTKPVLPRFEDAPQEEVEAFSY